MVRAGLRAIAEAGYQCALVLGEPKYYSRFGFDVQPAEGIQSSYAGPYFMAWEIEPGILRTKPGLTAVYSPPFQLLEDAA